MKRALLWYLAVAVVFLSGVVFLVILIAPRLGAVAAANDADQWVARQAERLAGVYLTQKLLHEDAILRSPKLLEIRNVRLVPRDNPENGAMAAAPLVLIHLAEPARFGQPIVITRIEAPGFQFARPCPGPIGWVFAIHTMLDWDNLLDPSHVDPLLQLDKAFRVAPESSEAPDQHRVH